VASASGGLAEVLDGTGAGLLYPPGDAGALAGALSRMLNEPGLAATSQAAGAHLVRDVYSWDAVVRRHRAGRRRCMDRPAVLSSTRLAGIFPAVAQAISRNAPPQARGAPHHYGAR
jgi:hypothetical protein